MLYYNIIWNSNMKIEKTQNKINHINKLQKVIKKKNHEIRTAKTIINKKIISRKKTPILNKTNNNFYLHVLLRRNINKRIWILTLVVSLHLESLRIKEKFHFQLKGNWVSWIVTLSYIIYSTTWNDLWRRVKIFTNTHKVTICVPYETQGEAMLAPRV